jgi:hypothetical protein
VEELKEEKELKNIKNEFNFVLKENQNLKK